MADRPDQLPDFESRPTIRLDHGMPEKDTVIELSDSAFRLMVEAICYCSRQESDGRVPKGQMRRMATKPGAIEELVRYGHIIDLGDGWELGDYLRWNRAKVEIDSFRKAQGKSGTRGAHMRWHVPQRKKVAGCPYCFPDG